MAAPLPILRAVCALTLCSLLLVAAPAASQVFIDDFDDNHIDADAWSVFYSGSGAQVAEQNQRLEFYLPPDAHGGEFGVRLISNFLLHGDFDIRVDFSLLEWPRYNGMRMCMGLTHNPYDDYGVERQSLSVNEPLGPLEAYAADFGPFVWIPTEDATGTLRLVRSGGVQTGYYYGAGDWVPMLSDAAPTEDITIQLYGVSLDYAFEDVDVRAAFDNFTVVTGELIGPPVATAVTSWGMIKGLYP